MTETMMALGEYRFGMNTAAYQQLARTHDYIWARQDRFGRAPASQFIGAGQETVSMTGIIYPHFRGGLSQLDAMRAEAAQGEPLILVDGNGKNWGRYVILKIKEGQSFIDGTGTPYKLTFGVDLRAYGEDGAGAQ